ncbi:MAG: UDP-glucose 4-epimerase family protein [Rheinheimera sp.]
MSQKDLLRIAVTGASGFVGRRLVEKLTESTAVEVIGVLRQLPVEQQPFAVVKIADLTETTDWSKLFSNTAVDVVVHCAARVHQMNDSSEDPLNEFRRVNCAGTLQLARSAAAAGVRRFVFISSVKVMGESTLPGAPYSVNDIPKPVDPYGISKLEAEQQLAALCQKTGMELVVIRPPLVYGPGVKANFLSMIKWVHRGIPLPLGAIHNQRSLVALDNLVDCIIKTTHHPAAAGQTFFVSDNHDVSTSNLLRGIARALGTQPRLIPIPMALFNHVARLLRRPAIAQRLCGSLQLDIRHTMDSLDWVPPFTFDEGLLKVAQHYQQSLAVQRSADLK